MPLMMTILLFSIIPSIWLKVSIVDSIFVGDWNLALDMDEDKRGTTYNHF